MIVRKVVVGYCTVVGVLETDTAMVVQSGIVGDCIVVGVTGIYGFKAV